MLAGRGLFAIALIDIRRRRNCGSCDVVDRSHRLRHVSGVGQREGDSLHLGGGGILGVLVALGVVLAGKQDGRTAIAAAGARVSRGTWRIDFSMMGVGPIRTNCDMICGRSALLGITLMTLWPCGGLRWAARQWPRPHGSVYGSSRCPQAFPAGSLAPRCKVRSQERQAQRLSRRPPRAQEDSALDRARVLNVRLRPLGRRSRRI